MSAAFIPRTIALAVITYYPSWYQGKLRSIKHTDKVRGDLALEFLAFATKLGYQVVCADGKSSLGFKRELTKILGIRVIKRRSLGRGPSKRQAIRTAAKLENVKVIVLTEAEKVSLLHFIPQIAEPILKGDADIIVPKREEILFKSTYPDYMYISEIEGNSIYNEELISRGLLPRSMADLDTFFGPRAFRNEKKVRSLFLQNFKLSIGKSEAAHNFFDAEEFSNIQYFPIVLALQKGMKVVSVEVPFSYPRLQKENESVGAKAYFILKRKMQRMSILIALMHFLAYLEKRTKKH